MSRSHLCRIMVGLFAVTGLASLGCTPTSPFLAMSGTPLCAPCQAVATWHNSVAWTPDPARGGMPSPVLAGRLYLFGPEIDFPLVGDGRVVVDLFDETTVPHGGTPVMLEQWNFSHEDLKRLMKKDAIGWGYTMVLPWGTYKPEIARVSLKLRYEPLKGTPLYALSSAVTLNHENNPTPGFAKRNPPNNSPALAGQGGPSNIRPASYSSFSNQPSSNLNRR